MRIQLHMFIHRHMLELLCNSCHRYVFAISDSGWCSSTVKRLDCTTIFLCFRLTKLKLVSTNRLLSTKKECLTLLRDNFEGTFLLNIRDKITTDFYVLMLSSFVS